MRVKHPLATTTPSADASRLGALRALAARLATTPGRPPNPGVPVVHPTTNEGPVR